MSNLPNKTLESRAELKQRTDIVSDIFLFPKHQFYVYTSNRDEPLRDTLMSKPVDFFEEKKEHLASLPDEEKSAERARLRMPVLGKTWEQLSQMSEKLEDMLVR
ncbi:MAG: hypothetical protein FWE53_03505 [Firmicutes bacterium]|nr:hypothetical protein [Bacillota bacterium]